MFCLCVYIWLYYIVYIFNIIHLSEIERPKESVDFKSDLSFTTSKFSTNIKHGIIKYDQYIIIVNDKVTIYVHLCLLVFINVW